MEFIQGYICYAKLTPVFKFESKTEKEFSVDIVVDKATAKAHNKKYPKQKAKEKDNEEFKEIFKIDPPFPEQDEQYIIKLTKWATFKDGSEVPEERWPKALQLNDKGKAVALPDDVGIANGSYGKVSYEEQTNSYGTFAKLRNILVEKLIPYEMKSKDAADDFGVESEVEGSDDFVQSSPEQPKQDKQTNKSSASKSAKKNTEADTDDVPW